MATTRRSTVKKIRSCPMCGHTADEVFRPFCSQRCKEQDLGRWLDERYRVPVVETDDLDENGETESSAG